MMYRKRRPLGAERAAHLAEEVRLQAKFNENKDLLEQQADEILEKDKQKHKEQRQKLWNQYVVDKKKRQSNYVKHLKSQRRRIFNAIS